MDLGQVVAQPLPIYWLGLGMRAAFLPDSATAFEVGGTWRTGRTAAVPAAWALLGLSARTKGSASDGPAAIPVGRRSSPRRRRTVGAVADQVYNRRVGMLTPLASGLSFAPMSRHHSHEQRVCLCTCLEQGKGSMLAAVA